MASIEFTARRAVFAVAIAAATVTAPVFAAPQVVADPSCENSVEPGDVSLNCGPQEIPDVGAPSEMELTESNPGIAGPHHRG